MHALSASGHRAVGVEFAGKAPEKGYKNIRSYMWWQMTQWVKGGGALPRCDRLARDLTEVMYTRDNGKLLIERKEDIKARIGRSPDTADALALTFALPEQKRSSNLYFETPSRDFDPLKD